MQPGEIRLSIDCGSASAVAVLSWPGGRWLPLLFDGVPQLPTVVYVDDDGGLVTGEAAWQQAAGCPQRVVPAPLLRLGDGLIGVGDADVDAVDLVAAILRRVGEDATRAAQRPVAEVRLVVPAGWGPRRRTLLRQAAHRAGLGQPTLVEAPVAAAQRVVAGGTTIVVGSYVVVCDFGGGFEATVLRRGPAGFEVLSSIDGPDAGGARIDEVLADELAGFGGDPPTAAVAPPVTDADRLVFLASARTAKESLTRSATVTVALPAPRPPVVLPSAQMEVLSRPVLVRAAQTTRQAIDAAGIRPDDVAGLYCVGGGATPLAARVLREETGLSPVVVDEPQVAAVLGAAQASGDAATAGDVEQPAVAPPLPPLRRLVGLLVPGVASLLLVTHFVASAESSSNRSRGLSDPYAYVQANWGELAMAATFALITALVGATLIASTLPPPDRGWQPAGSGQASQQIGTGLLAAAAVGLAVAGLYAVGGSVYFDLPTGAFLRWALLPILPIAVAVTVTAVLATRWGRIPAEGWHAWLNFPVTSVLSAAVGMLLIQVSMTAKAYPSHALANGLVGRFGALLLGLGAALALVRPARYRIIVAAPLAVFTAAIVSWPATGMLGVIYVAAVTVWWLQQVWRLLRTPRRAGRPAA